MAENDLVRLRPRDVAKVWGTALGQLVDLWQATMMALMELGSGEQPIPGSEQPIPSGQSNQISVPSADGQMPHLTAQNLVDAWAYAKEHPEEITVAIHDNEVA